MKSCDVFDSGQFCFFVFFFLKKISFKEREGGVDRNKLSLMGSRMIRIRSIVYGFMIDWRQK